MVLGRVPAFLWPGAPKRTLARLRRSIQFLVYCLDKKHFYDKAVSTSIDNRMSKYALRLLFSQRRWPAAYMSRDSGQGTVRDRSLQDLEGLDWGEANFDSHLVKFPRSQSPGYFAMRSTGDGGGRPFPAGYRENGKSREKIAEKLI